MSSLARRTSPILQVTPRTHSETSHWKLSAPTTNLPLCRHARGTHINCIVTLAYLQAFEVCPIILSNARVSILRTYPGCYWVDMVYLQLKLEALPAMWPGSVAVDAF